MQRGHSGVIVTHLIVEEREVIPEQEAAPFGRVRVQVKVRMQATGGVRLANERLSWEGERQRR